jgi:hypothetical protein
MGSDNDVLGAAATSVPGVVRVDARKYFFKASKLGFHFCTRFPT